MVMNSPPYLGGIEGDFFQTDILSFTILDYKSTYYNNPSLIVPRIDEQQSIIKIAAWCIE